MKWKIAICDDEEIYRNQVLQLCQERLEKEEIEADYSVYSGGIELLQSKEVYHLIFLDVEMGDIDGFEAAKQINEEKLTSKIIYITNHGEWMEHAFEVKAFRYLTKEQMEKIPNVMMDAIHELSENEGILVKEQKTKIVRYIRFGDVYALESMGEFVIIHLKDGYVVTRGTMKSMKNQMDSRMTECNRGFLVNLQKIKMIENNKVILKNGTEYKISTRKTKDIENSYIEYAVSHAKYR
ncbi:MAG: LytTR family DNA-binding domain-containing protein [Anaerostipes sp.]|nr:LytTR family DNA-binding domain-containing protein [Anaerostipes sp.]